MRTSRVISMVSLLILVPVTLSVLISCNSGEKNPGTDSAASTMNADTSMKHPEDTIKAVAALPAVPKDAKVYFRNLRNGETVKSPFKVEMGTKNIKVDTAGNIVPDEGHHHLIIDDGDSLAAGVVIPKDSKHLHFGKGQTFTMLELPKGPHRLTLQFGDGIHRSYGSQLAATIEIKVK
jgi:hypothetical protein